MEKVQRETLADWARTVHEEGIAQGRALERKAVVALLYTIEHECRELRHSVPTYTAWPARAHAIAEARDRIEYGEHTKGESK